MEDHHQELTSSISMSIIAAISGALEEQQRSDFRLLLLSAVAASATIALAALMAHGFHWL